MREGESGEHEMVRQRAGRLLLKSLPHVGRRLTHRTSLLRGLWEMTVSGYFVQQLEIDPQENGGRKGAEGWPHDMPDSCLQVVVVEQNGSFQVKIPKNFVCEHCFGAFRSSYHLKRHILIHTGKSFAPIQRGRRVYSLYYLCV